MNNIVLIGMPAAGKSTVGVVLAKRLCFFFEDTDLLIQNKYNVSLKELISANGIEGFLNIEEEICSSLSCTNSVIATGGSVIYRGHAMKRLQDLGIMVYLKVSLSELEKRMGDLTARGVILGQGQTLTELYDERTPLYEKWSNIIVDEENLTLEQTVDAVCSAIKAYID